MEGLICVVFALKLAMSIPARLINQASGVPSNIKYKPSGILIPDSQPISAAQFVSQVNTDIAHDQVVWAPMYPEYIFVDDDQARVGNVLQVTNVGGTKAAVFVPPSGLGDVSSVFGRTGAVVAVAGDYAAGQVTNIPAGDVTATTVQAAINQLDTLKLAEPSGATAIGNLIQDSTGSGVPQWTNQIHVASVTVAGPLVAQQAVAGDGIVSNAGLWQGSVYITGAPVNDTLQFFGSNSARYYYSTGGPGTITLPAAGAASLDGYIFTLCNVFGPANVPPLPASYNIEVKTSGGVVIYPSTSFTPGTIIQIRYVHSAPFNGSAGPVPCWYCTLLGASMAAA